MALRQQVGEKPSSQGRDGTPVEGAVEQQVPQLLRHQGKHLTLHSHPSTIAVLIGPHTFDQMLVEGHLGLSVQVELSHKHSNQRTYLPFDLVFN